ncbi:MAG: hypothetical protein H7237_03120 [Alkalinema sp. FL-bin-369]|nr:hypothetical protein [Leptolyngbyaceae cyanobacterium LF-bin-369]
MQAIDRLHRLNVVGRWMTLLMIWLTVGGWSLWQLRKTWQILQDYFTWSAIRVGLMFHPIAAVGLGLCIGLTLSTLIGQSRNLIWGLPDYEQVALRVRVLKIQQQGRSHPLWNRVWKQD